MAQKLRSRSIGSTKNMMEIRKAWKVYKTVTGALDPDIDGVVRLSVDECAEIIKAVCKLMGWKDEITILATPDP